MNSIRDASRWVVAAALMRQLTIEQHPQEQASVTEDSIAAELDDPTYGATIRSALDKIADSHRAHFKNPPPYVLATERVMETRALDLEALKRGGMAQLAFMEFHGAAKDGDAHAMEKITGSMKQAVQAIEAIRGPVAERQTLLKEVSDQCEIAATGDAGLVAKVLMAAQTVYLDELYEQRLSATQPALERSDEFDFTS